MLQKVDRTGVRNANTEKYFLVTVNNFTNSSCRNLDNVNGHLLAFK